MKQADNVVTLAVHTYKKAKILKDFLADEGIDSYMESVDGKEPSENSTGIKIRVNKCDLSKAMALVEGEHLFSYAKKETYLVDDGNLRILVPVDFSDYSMKACGVAFKIAKVYNAKVKIFTVYYNPYYPVRLPMADMLYGNEDVNKNSNILDKVKDSMQKLCAEIDEKVNSGEFPAVNYSYSIREGIAQEEIATYCSAYKPNLIVMGTKGGGDTGEEAIGSVTADIIEMVNIPVLAIPLNSYYTSPLNVKHVAFCTNFSERDLVTFDTIAKFSKEIYKGDNLNNIKITLLHLNLLNKQGAKNTEENINRIVSYFKEHYPYLNIAYHQIDTDDMIGSAAKFIDNEKVELIAVNTRRRNIFARIFAPSVSRKLLAKSKAALFILRDRIND